MNLEELIYRRFAGAEELTRHLTKYAGLPAVFSPEAPDDDQPGWNGEGKYPQITYQCDMQANEERKSAGTLAVTLVCQNTAEVSPEAIEDEIRKCLRDLLLVPDDEKVPYAFTWARTDAFTMPEKSPLLIGSDIRFDILEYGPQETTDPDPVMAVNQYIKSLYPEALVIGWDRIGSITEASKERPVAYCRLENVELSQETNTVAWMDCRLAVHFLCPDAETRRKLVMALTQKLALDGEVILLDRSPMFVKKLQANLTADYLTNGQLYITGHYGLLRYRAQGHLLAGAEIGFGSR